MDTQPEKAKETWPDWCARRGVTIDAVATNDTPTFGDPNWRADGWRCTLHFEGRTLTEPYWCGTGHREYRTVENTWSNLKASDGWRRAADVADLPYNTRPTIWNVEHTWFRPKPPTAADVLHSLLLDASGVSDGQSLEDWCSEFGYDADSRRAERMYRACQATALQLRGFLGAAYDEAADASQDY